MSCIENRPPMLRLKLTEYANPKEVIKISKKFNCAYKQVSYMDAWDAFCDGKEVFVNFVPTIDAFWLDGPVTKKALRLKYGNHYGFKKYVADFSEMYHCQQHCWPLCYFVKC